MTEQPKHKEASRKLLTIYDDELRRLFDFKEMKNGDIKLFGGSQGTREDVMKRISLLKEIRSRPDPAPSAGRMSSDIAGAPKRQSLAEHDADIRNDVLEDICKNCGAKGYGACVGMDCPVGAYESLRREVKEP